MSVDGLADLPHHQPASEVATGLLALVGGDPFGEGCTFDADLLSASGAEEVVVLPTAAAYEHPERLVAEAAAWFETLGVRTQGLMVLSRPDASDAGVVDVVRQARCIYLAGGSSMHLRSVLKETPLWDALIEAWAGGASVGAASGAAMAVCDPMVDLRGGAFTLGLGLVDDVAVVAEYDSWSHDRTRRTFALAGRGLTVVGLPRRTAILRDPAGRWRQAGVGEVVVHRGEAEGGVELLE